MLAPSPMEADLRGTMIDFHNHLIPGVDDGAATTEQSLAALRHMQDEGFEAIVATPHVSGSATTEPSRLEEEMDLLERGWEQLQSLAAQVPGIQVMRGAEVMLDTPAPVLTDPRLRLGGTSFVLVEFPFMSVPPNASQTLFDLKMRGWIPVLAHPERYANASQGLEDAREWVRMGAHLQLNAGSLLGKYGDGPRTLAWSLLAAGLASYVCSDYHARGRCHSAAGRQALLERGGEEQASLLMEANPRRLLEGVGPHPVPRLSPPRSIWSRLFSQRG